MGKRTISGPGRMGSAKAVKQSSKGGNNSGVRTIQAENSLTVRFLDEPEDWHGFYEHWLKDREEYVPCTTDECEGCDSDDPEEQRKQFRYLANAYVVDDQKVWALKMPKSLVEQLMNFYEKYEGTILDRDYELKRTGKGQNDTKYTAMPDSPSKMKLSRFDDKKKDLEDVLESLIAGDDDDAPKNKKGKRKPKKSSEPDPWDDEDEKPHKKKKSSDKKTTVKKKRTVARRK